MAKLFEKLASFIYADDQEYDETYETEYDSEVYEAEDTYTEYDNYADMNTAVNQEQTVFEQPVAQATQPVSATIAAQNAAIAMNQQQASTVVMLNAYDIRTSQIVCDHIRQGHIVICSLTTKNTVNESEAQRLHRMQRVVDFISGSVYALDGTVKPTKVNTIFLCTPNNINLIDSTESEDADVTKVSAI